MEKEFRTKLANIRSLGSSKTGSKHWLSQRISALALIFMVIWFVNTVIFLKLGATESIVEIITSPFNLTCLAIFISVSLFHGNLGMQVILEDYIHHEGRRFAVIMFLKFFSIISFIAALVSIITFYISDFFY